MVLGQRLARHDLLRVDPGAWADLLAARPDLAAEPLLAEWASNGWPLIARRRSSGDDADLVPAGIPLPPDRGKKRLVLDLKPETITATERPPLLTEVKPSAPRSWGPTIDALLALGQAIGREPRVFGSFAWSALTGLTYVSETSDLDLLWSLTPTTDLDRLTHDLAWIETSAPGRIDGELLDATGDRAVNWREWHDGSTEILIKTMDAVTLRPRTSLLSAGHA